MAKIKRELYGIITFYILTRWLYRCIHLSKIIKVYLLIKCIIYKVYLNKGGNIDYCYSLSFLLSYPFLLLCSALYLGGLALSDCIHHVPWQLTFSWDLPSGRHWQGIGRGEEKRKTKIFLPRPLCQSSFLLNFLCSFACPDHVHWNSRSCPWHKTPNSKNIFFH